MANVLNNPSFEADVTGWLATSGGSLVQHTTDASTGTASLRRITAGGNSVTITDPKTIYAASPGQRWSAGVDAKRFSGTARQLRVDIRWINSSGTEFAGTNGTAVTLTNSFQRIKVENVLAPANTAYAMLRLVYLSTAASGDDALFDAAQLEQGTTLPAYNEGTVPPAEGTAGGSWGFAGSATGKRSPVGSASGTFTFTGAATGKRSPKGTGAGVFTFAGGATGKRAPVGAAGGSYTYSGSATGARAPKGTAAGSWGFTGSATGTAPTVGAAEGTAAGSWGFTGSATGKRSPVGTASGVFAFTGAAVGKREPVGTAAGVFMFTGSAVGVTPAEAEPFREVTLVGPLPPDYTATQVTVELTATQLPDTHTATPLDPDTVTSRALPATHTARRI